MLSMTRLRKRASMAAAQNQNVVGNVVSMIDNSQILQGHVHQHEEFDFHRSSTGNNWRVF